jgi:predicted GNAT superfamily acetyltransferase
VPDEVVGAGIRVQSIVHDIAAAREDYEIAVATRNDISGILDLQEMNLPERGGVLSVRLSFQWLETALVEMPLIVARKDGRVVGYLVASSVSSQAHIPIVRAMLEVYSGAPNSYFYGPICVAASERGRGLPARLFAALRAGVGQRTCFTFIRRDNIVSLRAHAKIGLNEVAEFTFDGVALVIVAETV